MRYKILIVEDEGLIAQDIAHRLESLNHTVVATVGTAAEALELAPQADIVLMDIRIDGPIDGIQAAARLRSQFHIPVIFLTAHADRNTLERAKEADPFGFIVKPIATATLQTTLVMALHKHRVQRQLEESEAWLRAVQSAAADAIITTDVNGAVRTLNPAAERFFHGSPRTIGEVISGDPTAVAILNDGPIEISACVRQQQLEGFATPVKAGADAIGAVFTLRDVSARQQVQRRIRQLEKAEAAAELARRVSADYTSLVAVIRTRAEQLLAQFADYLPVRQACEEIQQAAVAAEQITRRLAGAGADEPGHPQIVSLHATLRKMAPLIQSVAGERVAVVIRPGARNHKIHADPVQVEDLLMRLVLNAGTALAQGGRLVIETVDAGEDISLSLTHDGVPVDPCASDLSLARYLVTDDGRRMEAFFPRWIEATTASSPPPTLLLIEAREHIRGRLHNFFEANGYNLLEAGDGEQARALMELQTVELVICERTFAPTVAGVPVLTVTTPYTQQSLLDQVRAALPVEDPSDVTLAASAC